MAWQGSCDAVSNRSTNIWSFDRLHISTALSCLIPSTRILARNPSRQPRKHETSDTEFYPFTFQYILRSVFCIALLDCFLPNLEFWIFILGPRRAVSFPQQAARNRTGTDGAMQLMFCLTLCYFSSRIVSPICRQLYTPTSCAYD